MPERQSPRVRPVSPSQARQSADVGVTFPRSGSIPTSRACRCRGLHRSRPQPRASVPFRPTRRRRRDPGDTTRSLRGPIGVSVSARREMRSRPPGHQLVGELGVAAACGQPRRHASCCAPAVTCSARLLLPFRPIIPVPHGPRTFVSATPLLGTEQLESRAEQGRAEPSPTALVPFPSLPCDHLLRSPVLRAASAGRGFYCAQRLPHRCSAPVSNLTTAGCRLKAFSGDLPGETFPFSSR